MSLFLLVIGLTRPRRWSLIVLALFKPTIRNDPRLYVIYPKPNTLRSAVTKSFAIKRF